MKQLVATVIVAIGLSLTAGAQEEIPHEEALGIARVVTRTFESLKDLQINVLGDADKPVGLRAGELGLLVLPGKSLGADTWGKVGKEVMPVAQLWTLRLAPARDGKVTANAKLRSVKVSTSDQEVDALLFLVGARKSEGIGLELVVYGKDKEAIAAVPLKKLDKSVSNPIEIEGEHKDDNTGVLTLKFQGGYKAEITLMKQEE